MPTKVVWRIYHLRLSSRYENRYGIVLLGRRVVLVAVLLAVVVGDDDCHSRDLQIDTTITTIALRKVRNNNNTMTISMPDWHRLLPPHHYRIRKEYKILMQEGGRWCRNHNHRHHRHCLPNHPHPPSLALCVRRPPLAVRT